MLCYIHHSVDAVKHFDSYFHATFMVDLMPFNQQLQGVNELFVAAVDEGHKHLVSLLLEKGVDIEGITEVQ
jgi:hypothetical protein